MRLIFFLLFSYLSGSVPFAYLAGKLLKGIDIREYGSKNIGATNVIRVIGFFPGIIVLLLDILKGLIPVLLAGYFYEKNNGPVSIIDIKIFAGMFAVSGHMWPVFLKFKGGKGVATTAGVLAGILPESFFIIFLIWSGIVIVTRYISLGSIIASILLPVLVFFVEKNSGMLLYFSLVFSSIIIYKHRGNIKRLLNGTENKLGKKIEISQTDKDFRSERK